MSEAGRSPREVVESINHTWTGGGVEEIAELLVEDAVITRPDGGRVKGREAFVETYREFVEHGTLHGFESRGWSTDLWDDTAVVAYRFAIDFEFGGERSRESGSEVWVLLRRDGRWRGAWRTIRSDPGAPSEE